MEDIHDIRGPYELLTTLDHILSIFYLLGAIALIWAAAWFFLKYKKTNTLPFLDPPAPKLSPYERAVNELITARELMLPGKDREFSIALSDAIRKYLENAYKLPAHEETTEEFLHTVKENLVFQGKSLSTLAKFLQMCDMAKFAKQIFSSEEQELIYEGALDFLELAQAPLTEAAQAAKTKEPQPAS